MGSFGRIRLWQVTLFCTVVFCAGLVIPTLTTAQSSSKEDTYRQLGLFGDIFQRVRESYVDEVEDSELIEAAITGMLTSLDPHSSFLNTENFSDMKEQTKGRFGGLGVEITMEQGMVKVVSPIDDTPAARAGLQPEDFLIAVDEESIIGMQLSEAVDRLRGKVGSKVKIKVQRGQTEPFDVTIVRDFIKIRSVRSEIFDGIGYVRITTFSEQTTPGLMEAVDDFFKTEGDSLKGIVLDLRNNPGGLLTEAVTVSDAFLEEGEIVSTRGRNSGDGSHIYAKPGDIARGLPMVVLINSGSASASEIVAGALKDHGRAIILGTRSFGKGSVQSVIPISNSSAIRLTTARYYTPSGISIQARGIVPDIEVKLARIEAVEGGIVREEDLRGALDGSETESDAGSDGNAGNAAGDDDGADSDTGAENSGEADTGDDDSDSAFNQAEIDYQLARALDLIRGVSIFGRMKPTS
ncbi:MAG: peptidase S41 [SAR116 cluster bacterium]|jgi:carboxyl-terminal processing protease|nr:peptidase S41 [SAR116 cluster bacterium]